MIELNLIPKNEKQQKVLDYLQKNASEVLAEKINKGIHVTVDGKELISVKDLSLFWTYAEEEIKKTIAQKDRKGCVVVSTDDADVFSMAIHYFEEDSIHGKLFNLDGTEYKTEIAQPAITTTSNKTPPKKKNTVSDGQISFFDFENEDKEQEEQIETEQDENAEEEQDDTELEELEIAQKQIQQVVKDYSNAKPFYKKYCEIKRDYMDCLVLYRLGDFYELFDKDAEIAGKILDLTITGREVGLPERVPLAGIPYHAVDKYVQRLSTKHKVLIYDSEETKYLVENGRKIDLITGEVAPALKSEQPIKQTTPPAETNPHIRYLQTIVKDLRADL